MVVEEEGERETVAHLFDVYARSSFIEAWEVVAVAERSAESAERVWARVCIQDFWKSWLDGGGV